MTLWRRKSEEGADRWFALNSGLGPVTQDRVIRSALDIVRSRIVEFWIVLDPEDVEIDSHQQHARHLNMRDDDEYAFANEWVVQALDSTGLDSTGRLIWDVNDRGESACFRLGAADLAVRVPGVQAQPEGVLRDFVRPW